MTNEQLIQVIKVLDAIGLHVLSISPEKIMDKDTGPLYTNKTVLVVIPASEEK